LRDEQKINTEAPENGMFSSIPVASKADIEDTKTMVRPIPQISCLALLAAFFAPATVQGQNSKTAEVIRYFSNESNLTRCVSFGGQPSPSKELRILLNRQAKWDAAGLKNPDQSGLRLRLVKIVDEEASAGTVPAQYRVFAEGAPEDKVFVLNKWPVTDALSIDPRDMYVNVQGLVMTHKPTLEQESDLKAPGDELEVQSSTEYGMPIRFALTGRDGEMSIYGTLVGNPAVGSDKGCKLEVRTAQPGATSVLITLDGFPGKAKVPLVLQSAGAQMSEVLDTGSDGHAVIAVVTTVPGVTEGTLKATAEGPKCLPSVVMPWSVPAKSASKTPEH
jgi:hypothetical protein